MSKRQIELFVFDVFVATFEKDLKGELIEAFNEDNKYLDFVVEALRKLKEEK